MDFVTGANIETFLNPEGSATKYLNASQNADAVASVVANANATIKGYMPEKYRRMMRHYQGVYLTKNAADGQTEFTLPSGLGVVDTDNSYIWVNLPGTYGDRDVHDAVAYTLAVDGVTITLDDALDEGDVVVMEIKHDGSTPPSILKKLALDVAVNEMLVRKPSLVNDPTLQLMYQQNYENSRRMLRDLSAGKLRIDEWDNLEIVMEHETATPEGPGEMIVGW